MSCLEPKPCAIEGARPENVLRIENIQGYLFSPLPQVYHLRMAEQRTDEQTKAQYVEAMGEELGSLFHALSNEVSLARERWTQFVILFGEKQSRIDLLNEAAGSFFGTLQELLLEHTLLAIARLIGPMKSAGHPQLALEALVNDDASKGPVLISHAPLRQQTQTLLEGTRNLASFATDWRHRRIAHHDLHLSLGKSPKLLEPVTREQMKKALSALRGVLNHVESTYCHTVTADFTISPLDDAQALLYVIHDGLLRKKERHARLERGEFIDEDVSPRKQI